MCVPTLTMHIYLYIGYEFFFFLATHTMTIVRIPILVTKKIEKSHGVDDRQLLVHGRTAWKYNQSLRGDVRANRKFGNNSIIYINKSHCL